MRTRLVAAPGRDARRLAQHSQQGVPIMQSALHPSVNPEPSRHPAAVTLSSFSSLNTCASAPRQAAQAPARAWRQRWGAHASPWRPRTARQLWGAQGLPRAADLSSCRGTRGTPWAESCPGPWLRVGPVLETSGHHHKREAGCWVIMMGAGFTAGCLLGAGFTAGLSWAEGLLLGGLGFNCWVQV